MNNIRNKIQLTSEYNKPQRKLINNSFVHSDSNINYNKLIINNGQSGEIFYDISNDQLNFKNKNGKIIQLNRDLYNIHSINDPNNGYTNNIQQICKNNNMIFAGVWSINKSYEKNSFIQDSIDYPCIYICKVSHMSSVNSRLPHDDNFHWGLVIPSSFMFRGEWNSNTQYKVNHSVADPINENIYVCKKVCKGISTNNFDYWDLFVDKNVNLEEPLIIPEFETPSLFVTEIPAFFGVFTNGTCCYKYEQSLGISVFNKKCPNNHKSPNVSTIYNTLRIDYKKDILVIPTYLIAKNNLKYYDFNSDNFIVIKEPGYYRITYNLSYHGSIFDIISGVSTIDNNNIDFIPYSISKSINRYINDEKNENYYDYNDNNPDILMELAKNINHSFYLPVKHKKPYIISLAIKINKNNVNKTLYIHPVKTWLCIDRIGDFPSLKPQKI